MKKKILALAATSLFLATGTAFAAGEGFYILGSVGQGEIDFDTGAVDKALKGATTGFKSSVDDSDTAYKLQLGYQINEYLAIEGGYMDLGSSSYNAKYNEGKANGHLDVDGWNFSGLLIWPANPSFSIFGKVGIAQMKTEISYKQDYLDSVNKLNAGSRDTSPLIGLGATYYFTPQASVRFEFEHIDSMGGDDSDIDGHLFTVGFSYKF